MGSPARPSQRDAIRAKPRPISLPDSGGIPSGFRQADRRSRTTHRGWLNTPDRFPGTLVDRPPRKPLPFTPTNTTESISRTFELAGGLSATVLRAGHRRNWHRHHQRRDSQRLPVADESNTSGRPRRDGFLDSRQGQSGRPLPEMPRAKPLRVHDNHKPASAAQRHRLAYQTHRSVLKQVA